MIFSHQPPDSGELFVIGGTTAAGKGTMLERVIPTFFGLSFSVSATSRAPRPHEENGIQYWFMSRTEFEEKIDADMFLEHAEVYGNYYGTLREPVNRALAAGHSIILEIDARGMKQVRLRHHCTITTIFVFPPSMAELRRRLEARQTESPEVIERRLRECQAQLDLAGEYQYYVLNDNLDQACADLSAIIRSTLLRRDYRQSWRAPFHA